MFSRNAVMVNKKHTHHTYVYEKKLVYFPFAINKVEFESKAISKPVCCPSELE